MSFFPTIRVSPLTRKRWVQFRRNRRAWLAFVSLAVIYLLCLAAPLVCRYKPDAIMDPAAFEPYRHVTLTLVPPGEAGRFNLSPDGRVTRPEGCAPFFPGITPLAGEPFTNHWAVTPALAAAVAARFANRDAPAFSATLTHRAARGLQAVFTLAAYEPRADLPASVRISVKPDSAAVPTLSFRIERADHPNIFEPEQAWLALPAETRAALASCVAQAFAGRATVTNLVVAGGVRQARVSVSDVTWPHRPVPGHRMGVDAAGRDVFARVVYGLRTALTFALLLVVWAMLLGFLIGAAQGYFGGWLDIVAQRLIEVWSALPFLYVMILIGAVLGRSFLLLLICYGLFNWIGLSYYMRAEFLRLRHRPFVEAARCQGLGHARIIVRHLLPNALTPVLTLFPFELVGAISALTALDFLGFGLPPLTPSLGELLQQAQQNRSAWWLVVYPAVALFTVMLLTVLVGEGLRDAFDPKPKTRLEG